MDTLANLLKAILFGIVEGVTEWLPVSSTGHMILLNEYVRMDVRDEFWSVFLVVIQLGAILAVVIMYWDKICPFAWRPVPDRKERVRVYDFSRGAEPESGLIIKDKVIKLWGKILIACVPAGIVGVLFDDVFDALFYKPVPVAIALIVFGIGFIVIETMNHGKKPKIRSLNRIDVKVAAIIGVFQLIAAVFPGTSRSGATILGALMIGVSRRVAAEFTFFLAIPVMAGASLLKLMKFGFAFESGEMILLATGMVVSFVVSVLIIRFLMGYIRKHNFMVFGFYRIILGILVIVLQR